MNRAFLLTGVAVALSLTMGMGCLGDAPHDNPLDPNSDRFATEGEVVGRVTDRAEAPLSEVEVRLILGTSVLQTELVTQTDAGGRFAMTAVPEGAGYRLLASKDGYDVGLLEGIDIRAGVVEELGALRLNALPAFTEATVRTVHISRWGPRNDLFFLEINAQVNDADGLFDIDAVVFEIPDFNFTIPLDPQTAGRFEKSIRADSLPTASLQSLLGRTLRLTVRDMEGVVVRSAPRQLVRVVEDTPITTAPRESMLLETGLPLFRWDPFPPRFPFTYRIDIFRDEANRAVLVRQISTIAMEETSLQSRTPLPAGPYFWTVTVVDEFGNQSRSKEAAFRIP